MGGWLEETDNNIKKPIFLIKFIKTIANKKATATICHSLRVQFFERYDVDQTTITK